MRKVLYISIAISLLIVAAALVHYNWRADQLREPLAQIPDSAAPEHRTAPSVDTQLLSLKTEAQRAEIDAMIQRMDEAYEAERARHKAAMAAIPRYPEHLERERLARRARIAALEAGNAMQSADDDPWDGIDLPPEVIKALKDGYANDATLRDLAVNGTDDEIHAYLSRTYLADFYKDAGLQ